MTIAPNRSLDAAFLLRKSCCAPFRAATVWFCFDWTTRYATCAINSNAVNSTGLRHGLRHVLAAAISQPTDRCRII